MGNTCRLVEGPALSRDDCGFICERLLGQRHSRWIARALRKWLDRRDPSCCYHELSKMEPGYYGWSVMVSDFEEFYKRMSGKRKIRLPEPLAESGVDTLAALRSRRSRRSYARKPLGLGELATLLYYTVGITGRAWWGGPKRTYPSAGGLQPVEAYVVSLNVDGLEQGVYHYNPGDHSLEEIYTGDVGEKLYRACLDQEHVLEAPANIVLTIVYSRTASKYGLRAYRYAVMDVAFAGENVYLVSEALGLATVAVGAFYDEMLCNILGVDCEWEYPMLVFPVGWRQT
ncbi:MAG: SagB/ThcOx family dehydrogenase [Crenarchaeota archaeon]|nr:SagB/ThcOx family dehydrogenase [Thermoproteota archaeon]